MKRILITTVAAGALFALPALAASPPQRLRGTVSSVDAHMMVLQPDNGSTMKIALTPETKYVQVEKSSLAQIEPGSYIGTATKSLGSTEVALEVVVFPPAMKGAGEGHYPWDEMADTSGGKTATTMTNGTVQSASSQKVATTMTNGTVASSGDKAGAKDLTVTYKGGEQKIVVPPTVPVVTLKPSDMAAVKAGSRVFVRAMDENGTLTAGSVVVGTEGVPPPM